jgi:hypothetical protein
MAEVIHRGERWNKPEKSANTAPANLECRPFPDTGVTAYQLVAGSGRDRAGARLCYNINVLMGQPS